MVQAICVLKPLHVDIILRKKNERKTQRELVVLASKYLFLQIFFSSYSLRKKGGFKIMILLTVQI